MGKVVLVLVTSRPAVAVRRVPMTPVQRRCIGPREARENHPRSANRKRIRRPVTKLHQKPANAGQFLDWVKGKKKAAMIHLGLSNVPLAPPRSPSSPPTPARIAPHPILSGSNLPLGHVTLRRRHLSGRVTQGKPTGDGRAPCNPAKARIIPGHMVLESCAISSKQAPPAEIQKPARQAVSLRIAPHSHSHPQLCAGSCIASLSR